MKTKILQTIRQIYLFESKKRIGHESPAIEGIEPKPVFNHNQNFIRYGNRLNTNLKLSGFVIGVLKQKS